MCFPVAFQNSSLPDNQEEKAKALDHRKSHPKPHTFHSEMTLPLSQIVQEES
jgi:hypothetical protein